MAKRSKGRSLDGIIVIDKPMGMTSNRALQAVKRLFNAAKAGHTGSLDPLATGVLPLCFGEATKVSQYLLDSDKSYVASIRLGVTTSTGDSEGEVLETLPVPQFTEAEITTVLEQFCGEITQIPPAYSALKQDGVPLYKLARAGKEIRVKERLITIYHNTLLSWQHPVLEIEVTCSKGTYIRTLAEDIGKQLGCGAHIVGLRRNKAGPFTLEQTHTLDSLQAISGASVGEADDLLQAADTAIDWMPTLKLSTEQTLALQQGKQVLLDNQQELDVLRVYSAERFIGIAKLSGGVLSVVRLMSTASD